MTKEKLEALRKRYSKMDRIIIGNKEFMELLDYAEKAIKVVEAAKEMLEHVNKKSLQFSDVDWAIEQLEKE